MALLVTPAAEPKRAEFGPGNLRLLTNDQLRGLFSDIHGALTSEPTGLNGIAIGMAGARTEDDRQRIRTAAAEIWPGIPCYATNDLETGLEAASQTDVPARVLVLSGTGSCCFGRRAGDEPVRFGGWGHLLGDGGSGYDLGMRALRAIIYDYDLTGTWPVLGQEILRLLQLNLPTDLIDWVKNAEKSQIAALSRVVFDCASRGDRLARGLASEIAKQLANDAANCAKKLGRGKVEFVLTGGLLKNQPGLARQVGTRVRKLRPGSLVRVLDRESAWGAIELARAHFGAAELKSVAPGKTAKQTVNVPVSTRMSPTEERNPRSMELDKMPVGDAIDLFVREDSSVPAALLPVKPQIERAIEQIVQTFQSGGRLFYIGAGTSGRLGVLDASEVPPTFRASPQMVQGIMAGGYQALWSSIEGAEDDPSAGVAAVQHRGVTGQDVLMGIAASGRTPFVWGALDAAHQLGAKTILLCFNPYLDLTDPVVWHPDIVIAPNLGPEILTGSTRLKAGTATKLVLNMITTISMVRLGKVKSNLMVDVNPSNVKLRDRAVRIVQTITGLSRDAAESALIAHKWDVKATCEDVGDK